MPVTPVGANALIPADPISPNSNIVPPTTTQQLNVPPVSSMVEYNLHRLASISSIDNGVTSTDLTDAILPTASNFCFDEMLNGGDQVRGFD